MKTRTDVVTQQPVGTASENELVIAEFADFISNDAFPCVAAKAALNKEHIQHFVADHMACPKDDHLILRFLYNFVDGFRSADSAFHTAAVIFKGPTPVAEAAFDELLWKRLQALADMDSALYNHDQRVDKDPSSPAFSFSLKEEAFYVVGMNPGSSRQARRFRYPTLVFNAHAQFEQLRSLNRYEKMKNIIRKRDLEISGSINPMLQDFGNASEVHQYSGMQHDGNWKCPLNFS